jgi:aspartate-semialdehyde dehydrogenase
LYKNLLLKIAIIGATGLVGQKMIQVLEEFQLPVSEILFSASEKSVGKTLMFNQKPVQVSSLNTVLNAKPDIVLFSAGSNVSLEFAPLFAENGSFVIDNSSAWRMKKDIPLIVPEINAGILSKEDKIIANPNCSTIQLVVALNPIHQKYKINRVVVSTYQSITGTGYKAVDQLEQERKGENCKSPAYPYPIDLNCIPQCDIFLENNYTKEEMKLVNETCKILNDDSIRLTATAVRVPVMGGHSESVNLTTGNPFEISDIIELLNHSPGIEVMDNPKTHTYPMPLTAKDRNEVFVGRIRKDYSFENSLNLWIVSDNLRKGAATNAIQITKYLIDSCFVSS